MDVRREGLRAGCYLPNAQAAVARAYGLMVLTLDGDRISAITWFGERSLVPYFGCHERFRGTRRPTRASQPEFGNP